MTKQERLLGQTILDFANAENTDEACFEHFENIQNIMKFSPNFQERARKFYPFYAMPSLPTKSMEDEYWELSREEKELIRRLEDKSNLPFKLESRSWADKYELLLDFSCTYLLTPPDLTPPEPRKLKRKTGSKTRKTIKWRLYSHDPLHVAFSGPEHKRLLDVIFPKERVNPPKPEVLLQIRREHEENERKGMTEGFSKPFKFNVDITDHERLAAIYDEQSAKDDIVKLKGVWDRLNTIYVAIEIAELRHQLKDLLQEIVSGRRYDDIPGMETHASIYNNLPREKVIVREFELEQVFRLNEEDYLEIRWPKEWITRFKEDIAYCLIEFLVPEGNKNYIAKCLWCEKYFIRTKYNPAKLQKFCRYNGDGCKDDWHNRERVKSGKAAKYIKNGRAEGKYQ